ncbi:hypothetical protein SAMN02745857_03175 [Andreprevotia lacus DSM 23236]|uniref:Uncharacterized protein n=1 Tax=Andreprevotia lacus DSM 23236 TaxID=1121001 RepID=A0A1W1XW78_9NEIS|nr:hypothetical protein [Andreprevotia lacus]SMC28240.1 hypothetical protein SAMN02745857_03175 [Andreprevotia lacus DSM 23236]
MATAPRFRFSESAAIRKHVLRISNELVELLVARPQAPSLAGARWLHAEDLAGASDALRAEGQRLLGLYLYLDDSGTVTEIRLPKMAEVVLH